MKNILLVDFRLVAYETFHGHQSILHTFRLIADYAQHIPNPTIYYCVDSTGGSARRKELFPEYKAHRKENDKKKSPAEQKRLAQFNKDYEKLCTILPLMGHALNIEGTEADDVGNIMAKYYGGNHEYMVYMLSSDKDWASNFVYGDNVRQIHLTRGMIYPETCFSEYELEPQDILRFQALSGVAKENVPGIYKFGIAKYKKLVEENDSMDDILSVVQSWVDIGKYGCRILAEFDTVKEMYEFNMELLRQFTIDDLTDEQRVLLSEQANKKYKNVHKASDVEEQLLELFGVFHHFQEDLKKFYRLT